jgi:hypothetical protein
MNKRLTLFHIVEIRAQTKGEDNIPQMKERTKDSQNESYQLGDFLLRLSAKFEKCDFQTTVSFHHVTVCDMRIPHHMLIIAILNIYASGII